MRNNNQAPDLGITVLPAPTVEQDCSDNDSKLLTVLAGRSIKEMIKSSGLRKKNNNYKVCLQANSKILIFLSDNSQRQQKTKLLYSLANLPNVTTKHYQSQTSSN